MNQWKTNYPISNSDDGYNQAYLQFMSKMKV